MTTPAQGEMMNDEPVLSQDQIENMDTEPFDLTAVDAWMGRADRQREAVAHLEGSAWFDARFAETERALLQPLDETVNYAVVIQSVDPWTDELAVEKYWKLPDGYVGMDGVTLRVFDADDSDARAEAETKRGDLLDTYATRGLEALMHDAELTAMHSGWLYADRANPALFQHGPPDRFESLAERLRDEPNPYWNTDGDGSRTPEPGSWDELLTQEGDKAVEALPDAPFDRLWQVWQRSVETPEGTPSGHSVSLVYYPDIHQDAFKDGDFSDADYPTHAKTLEMARFETAAQAQNFAHEFERYIVPGVLDPLELAEEVAKLEGLPVEWQDMEHREIGAVMGGERITARNHGWNLEI